MKKQTRNIVICLTVLIFLAGLGGSIWVLRAPHGQTVQIVQDGIILHTIDLSSEEDQIIQVEYEGRVNTIEIQNGRVHMLEADCPDHTCIQMGWLDSVTPIVCLPNHLVIQFVNAEDAADAIVQ